MAKLFGSLLLYASVPTSYVDKWRRINVDAVNLEAGELKENIQDQHKTNSCSYKSGLTKSCQHRIARHICFVYGMLVKLLI